MLRGNIFWDCHLCLQVALIVEAADAHVTELHVYGVTVFFFGASSGFSRTLIPNRIWIFLIFLWKIPGSPLFFCFCLPGCVNYCLGSLFKQWQFTSSLDFHRKNTSPLDGQLDKHTYLTIWADEYSLNQGLPLKRCFESLKNLHKMPRIGYEWLDFRYPWVLANKIQWCSQ